MTDSTELSGEQRRLLAQLNEVARLWLETHQSAGVRDNAPRLRWMLNALVHRARELEETLP